MQPANTADVHIDSMQEPVNPESTSALAIPWSISLPVLLVVGSVSFAVLNSAFPVFVIAQELLAQMPPDGVAKVRETAFARCRLTNTMLAVSTISLGLAILLPATLIITKRVHQRAVQYLIPVAVASSLVSCIGVLLGHAVMELTASHTLGMTRTFLAHWFEFGIFGAGIGLSVGMAIGNRELAINACQKGLVTGLIAATIFDLISVVLPHARIDTLIPGGVLWGSHDSTLIAMWVAFLLLPLAIGLRKIGQKAKSTR
jgi:hypothetical protein